MDSTRKEMIKASIDGEAKRLEELIVSGGNFEQEFEGQLTPLFWASTFGQTECVDILLRHGANADEHYGDGKSVLICTVLASNITVTVKSQKVEIARFLQVVKSLIASGADADYKAPPDAKYPHGYTAFEIAKRPEIVDYLSNLP